MMYHRMFLPLYYLFFSGCIVLVPYIDDTAAKQEALRVERIRQRYALGSRIPEQQRTARSITRNVDKYIRQLKSPKSTLRSAAAAYLGMMGPKAADAVPNLMYALNDEERYVRRSAARALGQIGAPAFEARQALERTTKDRDPYVARTARLALTALSKLATSPIKPSPKGQ